MTKVFSRLYILEELEKLFYKESSEVIFLNEYDNYVISKVSELLSLDLKEVYLIENPFSKRIEPESVTTKGGLKINRDGSYEDLNRLASIGILKEIANSPHHHNFSSIPETIEKIAFEDFLLVDSEINFYDNYHHNHICRRIVFDESLPEETPVSLTQAKIDYIRFLENKLHKEKQDLLDKLEGLNDQEGQ